MSSEKISVIVPVYNVEEYLKRCIDSIINQTYQNLEIILVDDGSPDNCPKMCDDYAERDGRIKAVHKENGGLASARNAGLKIADGAYITFVDSDDYIKSDMLEQMLALAKNNSADVVQIAFEREKAGLNESEVSEKSIKTIIGDDNIRLYALDRILRPEACGKLYKSELFKNIEFNSGIKYAEDVEFGLRFYKNVKCSVVSNEKMYFYSVNPNSLTASSLSPGRLAEPVMLLNAALAEKNCGWLYKCILFRYVRCVFAVLNRMVSENREDTYEQLRNGILGLKGDIFANEYLGVKYKIGTVALMMCKSFEHYQVMWKKIKR